MSKEFKLKTPLFLFDADCGICEKGTNAIREKVKPLVDIVPYQTVNYSEFGVRLTDITSGPIFINEHGIFYVGPLAMSQMLMRARGIYRVIGKFLWLPGVRHFLKRIGPVMYKNRGYLPGATDACRIEKV